MCEKWLKDRKGQILSNDDIQHWQRVVVALGETRRLMDEIDVLIPEWPMQCKQWDDLCFLQFARVRSGC